jgi:hypothetical protein
MSLPEVARFVRANKHLPGVPSEKEVAERGGFSVAEMNRTLLAKVEELTLYAIAQDETLRAQAAELSASAQRLADLEERLRRVEAVLE